MNNELKVSFYIKREKSATNACGIYPVIGKIIVGGTLAQFSSKLKVDERLWDVKSGRATGKSRQAVELNRAINHSCQLQGHLEADGQSHSRGGKERLSGCRNRTDDCHCPV